MKKQLAVLLFSLGITVPTKTFATVCGVIPDSYELALSIIELIIALLSIAVIVTGGLCLYRYFFTENKLGWSGQYFWWLFVALILAVLISILVYLDAPKACGIGPRLELPII